MQTLASTAAVAVSASRPATPVGAACAIVASHLLLLRVLGPCALASFVEGDCRRDDETTNNIGRRDAGARARRYGPIDVVYTWVNGSDPVWLAAKARYTPKKHQRRRLLCQLPCPRLAQC